MNLKCSMNFGFPLCNRLGLAGPMLVPHIISIATQSEPNQPCTSFMLTVVKHSHAAKQTSQVYTNLSFSSKNKLEGETTTNKQTQMPPTSQARGRPLTDTVQSDHADMDI